MFSRLLTRLFSSLVRGYQLIVSPWFAPTCRYYPSCSQYAIDALKYHGPLRAVGLATWRLLRCNPWSAGGVDHVPGKAQEDSHGLAARDSDFAPISVQPLSIQGLPPNQPGVH